MILSVSLQCTFPYDRAYAQFLHCDWNESSLPLCAYVPFRPELLSHCPRYLFIKFLRYPRRRANWHFTFITHLFLSVLWKNEISPKHHENTFMLLPTQHHKRLWIAKIIHAFIRHIYIYIYIYESREVAENFGVNFKMFCILWKQANWIKSINYICHSQAKSFAWLLNP